MKELFRKKSIEDLVATAEAPEYRLKRSLGPWSLAALGLGAVIGTGIFVLTGTAAAGDSLSFPSILKTPVLDLLIHGPDGISDIGRPGAGPAIILSFLLTALACSFAALCFAELASMIPVSGSTYTYTYATMGELTAWIIGWDLILEYAVSNMAVAVGFSAYFNDVLSSVFGLKLPAVIAGPMIANGELTGNWFNLPAFIVLMILTCLLVIGVRQSVRANNLVVIIKIGAILLFIFGAMKMVQAENWRPFMPNGWTGMLTGAALIFFTYIGFDSVSTAAEECKNPQRDLPFGIIATLVICAILYCGVAAVLTGITDWRTLNTAAPVADALHAVGLDNVRRLVALGALIGMVSSILVFQYGQARVWFAMSRDGLLPKAFSRVHPKYRTPHVSTWVAGLLVGIPAGIWDIGTFAELSSIGTLFAFALISTAVLRLRNTHPEHPRGFRVPGAPWTPLLSISLCATLMLGLPVETWLRFFAWLGIGLAIYFLFSHRHSRLAP